MSKLRPVSASVVAEAPTNTTLPVTDKGKKRSLIETSRSDGSITGRSFLSPAEFFSSSLDEESGLEDQETLCTTNRNISTVLDCKMPATSTSGQPPSDKPKRDIGNNIQRDITSPPNIKLKPRPVRRSSEAISLAINAGRSMMPSSISKTPPPKILIPILPSRLAFSSLEIQEMTQKESTLKLLQSPPLIKRLTMKYPSSPTTPDGSNIRRVMSDPRPFFLKKKTKLSRSVSTPLLSPPKLTPCFDFGISTANGDDAITPPLALLHPPALITTPPSATIVSHAPLPMDPGEAILNKYDSRKRVVVPTIMTKPIALRPVVIPSTQIKNHHHETDGSSVSSIGIDSGVDDYTSLRIFPKNSIESNANNVAAIGVGVSISSSIECSAFSFSSRSTTIRRTLSADDDD